MAFAEILYQKDGPVLTVTLNRPDALNAWTRQMEAEVREAMIEASKDDGVRAIVLTGAGRGFCAGADMNLLGDIQDESSAMRGRLQSVSAVDNAIPGGLNPGRDYSMRYAYFPTVPKPILAAVNGPCAGLGMIMALYCDMRFAARSAVFTTAFSRRGLIAEHGISWMLPALVGHANALDLLLSARKVTSEEARQMGLVNRVIEDERFIDETRAYAEELATMVSPRSIRVMKQQVYQALHQSLESAILTANSEMPASFDSADFKEGVAHFVEKRAPNFPGR
ncbi:enoyl-CoA hydratase [Minwuia thermotolerans]|uniref:Enoyl-CoA hydratase n=1 Tax=Minwuia thermotolerans TaxID=2056226 RepID=A0A2M9FYE0_9PROT|nr:enoyl-CoA hydratase [Minwuia thermotolerans]PJK28470.1 enoyl-CoA hydratase [Minwuia thermotolerans]